MSISMGGMNLGVSFVGDLGSLQRTMDQADTAVGRFGKNAQNDLKGVAGQARQTGSALDGLANGIKGAFVGSSIAVGLITLKNSVSAAVGAITEAQVQVDRLRNGFRFGAGGAQEGAAEFAFVREEADRLGLVLNATATQYMKLVAASRGTTLAGEPTRQVFTAVAEAAAVMGMNADQSERSLLAVTQMMSKGKVMAEELRGQLGEQLPGAFAIAARAMGVTEVELNKMLETGQVLSADFLPKFAAQLRKELAGSVAESSLSMQANLNRMATAWQNLKQQVAQGGAGSAISGGVQILAGDVKVLGDVLETSRKQGDGFWLSVANVSGAVVGRAGFGALEQAANGVNGSLNFLSGGILKLNTQVQLMPDNLRSTAEQFDLTNRKIAQAETEYAALSARLAQAPDNIYIKSELGNLARYIGALRLARSEQIKLQGETAGKGSIGSVGSGDTALLRAQRGEYEKELAARAALRKKYATPAEKLSEEIAAQKALLGSLFGPEEEARIRASMGGAGGRGGGGAARAPQDPLPGLLNRLTSKDAGLDPSFGRDLETLRNGYAQGRMGVDAYRQAVDLLVTSQQFAKDAADASRKAVDAENDANTAAARSLQGVVDAAQKQAQAALQNAQAAEMEAEAVGKNTSELHQLEQARLADAAAALRQRAAIMENIDLSGQASESLLDQAAATERTAAARQRAYLRGMEEESKSAASNISYVFTNAFKGMEDALVGFVQTGKLDFGSLANSIIADMTRIAIQQSITGPLTAALGSSMGSIGSLFGFAKGAAISSPSLSAYSGGVYNTPQTFAFASGAGVFAEAGPEAIMPLKRGANGRLGVQASGGGGGMVVNIIEAPGQGGTQQRRTDNGVDILDVFVDKVRSAVAGDIVRGTGAVPAAMASTYGLNRVAGAY